MYMMNLTRLKTLIIVAMGVGLLSSCMNSSKDVDNPVEQLKSEVAAIDKYLDENNITAIKDIRGIRMEILQLGTGFPAHETSSVNVDYEGKIFTTGALFDNGNVEGRLQSYIGGWQIALTTLPAGSQARLYIPSVYAYGPNGQGSIPGNSTLLFTIKFNKVLTTTTEAQKLSADTVAIDKYLADENIVAIKDPTGLRYVVSQLGGGPTPSWYHKVKFKSSYKLLTDDTNVVFEIETQPTENTDNRVIDQIADGVKLGLQKLPVGSKATLYIPSKLAFGTQGATNGSSEVIPANANIIVDIELTEIVSP
jgi:FKBP-type peptidyl-prolyl cis-trans isomerase FkpA